MRGGSRLRHWQDGQRRIPRFAGLANPRTVGDVESEGIHIATDQERLLTRED